MDRDQLESFIILADTGNFTKTSELLHVVQSTITTRIHALESQVGKKLFDRGTRYVRLTPAGAVFLEHAEKIIEQMDAAITETRARDRFDRRLVIGGLNSIWSRPDFYNGLERLIAEEKRIAVRIVTDHSAQLINRIQQGALDAAFVYQRPHARTLKAVPFKKERILLVGHPSIRESTFSAEQIPYNQFIYYSWGTAFEEWFRHEFTSHHVQALRIDHAGLALQLMLHRPLLGFLIEGIVAPLIATDRLRAIKYQAITPIPSKWIYLVFLKSREHEQAWHLLLHFMKK
ncbi:MAG: LysR family transcriptional regulator [Sporolactobacillus sp.]|jgi:LysR family transcriptional repressor of citA|nr:LysR family transcriptional regulator [Sporolactobacillus sp.]